MARGDFFAYNDVTYRIIRIYDDGAVLAAVVGSTATVLFASLPIHVYGGAL